MDDDGVRSIGRKFLKRAAVEKWIQRYTEAWLSNDPQQIRDLFAEEAVYRTGAFDEPWEGRADIARNWIAHRDEPGDWDFQHKILSIAEGLAVVEGRTRYQQPPAHYANLWLIRLDGNGRCTEFTEYWMEES
jgi:hypothetical protein